MPNDTQSPHEMMSELQALEEMIADKCSVSAIDNSSCCWGTYFLAINVTNDDNDSARFRMTSLFRSTNTQFVSVTQLVIVTQLLIVPQL